MSLCPFCKKPVSNAAGPCPSCGRRPGDHPSVQQLEGRSLESGWGDDDLGGGGLELSRGGGHAPAAIAAPSSYSGGGMSLGDDDDPFAEDAAGGSLELDVPPPPAPAPTPLAPRSLEPTPLPAAASPSAPALPAAPVSLPAAAVPAAPPPPDPAAMIARLPAPPTRVWHAPGYALTVLYRQYELRRDLESLRRRRSPDVRLYERALTLHDRGAFAVGLAITCAALTIAAFVFFLPVILRFVRDPR